MRLLVHITFDKLTDILAEWILARARDELGASLDDGPLKDIFVLRAKDDGIDVYLREADVDKVEP
jgi:hypothetical protein